MRNDTYHRTTSRLILLPLVVAACLFLSACKSPRTDRFPPTTNPLSIEIHIVSDIKAPETEHIFEKYLRDSISEMAKVLPDRDANLSHAFIQVFVEPLGRTDAAMEAQSNVAESTLETGEKANVSPLTNVVASSVISVVTLPVTMAIGEVKSISSNIHLGYKPRHLRIKVIYWPLGSVQRDSYEYATDAFEVTKAMRPLTTDEVKQPGRLRLEEARALSQVITDHLKNCGWSMKTYASK